MSVSSTPRTPVKLKKSPGSPQQMQSASLGRATAGSGIGIGLGMGVVSASGVNGNGNGNGGGGGGSPVPRRNSLGDLKIPARISQAQVSLRRDIGFVREFAASIERTSVSSSSLLLWLTKAYRTERPTNDVPKATLGSPNYS